MGASALQSPHQCAQKKSSTGWPFSAASDEGRVPSQRLTSRAGAACLQGQQIEVLLNTGSYGRAGPSSHLGLEVGNGLRAPAAGRQRLRMHFDGCAQRGDQRSVSFPHALEQIERQLPRLGA